MKKSLLIFSAIAFVSGCASTQHVAITTEHKGKTTIVHHRRRVANGSIDHIEAISSTGAVTEADIHVFDVGRMPDGHGGIVEAHRLYRVDQDQHLNLMLPKHVSSGPKTVLTPPNYSPIPNDQRVGDAVTEIRESKEKLDEARNKIEKKISEDNNIRGELEQAQDANQALRDQLAAAMNTPKHKPAPTPAELAAQSGTSELADWGKKQQQQNQQ